MRTVSQLNLEGHAGPVPMISHQKGQGPSLAITANVHGDEVTGVDMRAVEAFGVEVCGIEECKRRVKTIEHGLQIMCEEKRLLRTFNTS